MRRGIRWAALALTTALAVAACGGDEGTTTGGTPGGTPEKTLKVGMAYDIGGRGDQSFNDAAAAGLDKAKAEFQVEARELEVASTTETDADREERLRTLAEEGYNPIICVGFVYSTALAKVAPQFANTQFAIIDDANAKGPNIANLVFAEEQGSYLVGVAAALKSKKGTVGFVGGVQVPLIKKFEAGYKAGAEAGRPGTKVLSQYLTQPPDFTGFNDPAKGKAAAEGMFDQGADVVYHAAGGSGSGVFEAAKAAKGWAIGVDKDQYKGADPSVRDVIITSMIKKVDVAVYDFLKDVHDNAFKAGTTTYDLKQGGIDYATSGGKIDDIKSQLDGFKQKIIDGQVTVPTK